MNEWERRVGNVIVLACGLAMTALLVSVVTAVCIKVIRWGLS